MSISGFGESTEFGGEQGTIEMRQLVCFRLAEGDYALDIQYVREINRLMEVTKIPTAPSFVEGIMNLRGTVVPVVNLGLKFGLAETEHTKDSRIVVVESSGHTLGMIVDEVSEVLRLPADEIESSENLDTSGINVDFVDGVGVVDDRLILLLSPDRLFTAKERAMLLEIGS